MAQERGPGAWTSRTTPKCAFRTMALRSRPCEKRDWLTSLEVGAVRLTQEEVREWFQIRNHVRDAVLQLEVCGRCWRVRDQSRLFRIAGTYCCRPDDDEGCLASRTARTLRAPTLA